MPNRQKGFTLVEIAIVLVIIGLLLGGILKGQELITSARVRNLADQNSGIQAAYYGFIDRFRQVPGDMKKSLAAQAIDSSAACMTDTATGAGNGRLEVDDYAEASCVWHQLALAGFIQGAYKGTATDDGSYQATDMAPRNAFNGYVMLTRTTKYLDTASTPPTRLALVLGQHIPVNVLRELDVKIDDSLPRTGVLRHTSVSGGSTVFDSSSDCVSTDNPPIWDINKNQQECNAIYLY
ncbi:MAG: prepilin-type N-terminal cleavage/methylation domain-containing protein [Gammaproteobacteria bacterium]|nr:MAG: prepilin-type N-terminal cleavage/methylation domain-containing protein [Gammaproteobacteria bacterium]